MTPAVLRVVGGVPSAIFPTVPFDDDDDGGVLAMDFDGIFYRCDYAMYESGILCQDEEQMLKMALALTEAGFLLWKPGTDTRRFGMEPDSPLLLRPDGAWTRFHDKMRRDALEAENASYGDEADSSKP
jgi:hypothetical protein